MILIKDDMIFVPYLYGGYQCKMKTKRGIISVRCGSDTLFTSKDEPYEVWYPDRDEPNGYQTADDIWKYIRIK